MGELEVSSEKHTPRYDVSQERVDQLTDELLAENASKIDGQYRYVAIEINNTSRYTDVARHIERTVFEEAFNNDAEVMAEEYGPYEDASRFFISIDRTPPGKDRAIATGALRIIENSQAGLKTLNDAVNEPFAVSLDEVAARHTIDDLDTVWDVGTVAVLPEYRKGEGPVSVQLYRAMYLSALDHGIEHLVSIIDDRPLQKLVGYLGIPFGPLGNSKPGPYLGSEKSHAVYGHVPEFYKKMSRHMWTPRGLMAREALKRLVRGSEDTSLILSK